MKTQTKVSIDAHAKVVVHHKNAVFTSFTPTLNGNLIALEKVNRWRSIGLVRAEDDRPPVEANFLRLNDVFQHADRVLLARIARAPAKDPCKVVSSSKGNDAAGRRVALRFLADVVEALKDPTDGSVTATDENFVVFYLPKDV